MDKDNEILKTGKDYFDVACRKDGRLVLHIYTSLLLPVVGMAMVKDVESVRLAGDFQNFLANWKGVPRYVGIKDPPIITYYGDMAKFIVANVLVEW